MRFVMILSLTALAATSACGSSRGHPAGSAAAVGTKSPGAAATSSPAAKADIPGFSGPVESSSGSQDTHLYGRCLHSWYAKARSGMSVHVEYPGPATVSVDLTITDQSEPPPEAHQQFTMAKGQRVRNLRFPAIPRAGYPQITVTAGQGALTCEAPKR